MEYISIKQIKEQYTCLDFLGEPVKQTRHGWLYRVPWREDKNPSLSVTSNGKGWRDLATGEHGSVIDLVMRCLNTTDVRRACEEIMRHAPGSFSFSQFHGTQEKEREETFTKFEVVKLQSRGLFAYLHSRKINIPLAKQFLQEAHFSYIEGDSYLYALAFANNKGGYELRSAPCKSYPNGRKISASPKTITTHMTIEGAPVVVFEGFMDMLSCATLSGGVKHNDVVLNSVSNKDAAIEFLRDEKAAIYLCLDNDEAGDITTKAMLDALPTAADIRRRFAPHKDVNDYLCHLRAV